jgi:hypothetical protein
MAALFLVGALAAAAQGSLVNLNGPGSFGVVNGARFETPDLRPDLPGSVQAFAMLSADGIESGYNTSATPAPLDGVAAGLRDLMLGDVPARSIGGALYYEFLLNIDQRGNGSERQLSLDALKIYTSSRGGASGTDLSALGTLRYDLSAGGNTWVKLSSDTMGVDAPVDMRLLVPAWAFAGAAASDYLYLYSQFGANKSANSGAEVWMVQSAPEPWAGLVLAAALCARRRAR